MGFIEQLFKNLGLGNTPENFQERYEQAVKTLTQEERSQVAGLSRSRLEEWVMSPPEIRPEKLRRWREQQGVAVENVMQAALFITDPAKNGLTALRDRIRQSPTVQKARRTIR